MRLIGTMYNDEKAYDTPECYRKSETLETMVIFGKWKTMQGCYKNENLTHFLLLKFRKACCEDWEAKAYPPPPPHPSLMVYKESLGAWRQKKIEKIFGFRQKTEARRKWINTFKVAIEKFNDFTIKHMNQPCVFNFYVVFLKSQNISSTYMRKTNFLFGKKRLFPLQSFM